MPVLTRRYMERRKQTKSYYNPNNGNLFSEVSKVHRLGTISLIDVLKQCDTDVLYVLPVPKGNYINPDSMYPTKTDLQVMGVQIVKWYNNSGKVAVNGNELDILPISRWFDVTPDVALQHIVMAMRELEVLLNDAFCVSTSQEIIPVEILETPTRTGMDLLKRKLPFSGKYENLPEDIETIIMSNFSQQRRESFVHGEVVEDLHCYDGRLMYGACYRELAVGTPIHDNNDAFMEYIPALYRVDFTVPATWKHIGLFPVKSQLRKGSMYPNMPRQEGESWCSYEELMLARAHNWKYQIRERVLWPMARSKGYVGRDPLRYWGDTLVNLREKIVPQKYEEPIRTLLRSALRHLLLDPIGGLHSAERTVDVYIDDLVDLYDMGYMPEEELPDGTYHARIKKQMTAYQRQMFQPHWSLFVWCRAKKKITQAALTIPYEKLVLIRADALWTQGKIEHFVDDGKVGTFREKELINRGPFKTPIHDDENEIRRMMSKAKGLE